jgi:hypothetical protein
MSSSQRNSLERNHFPISTIQDISREVDKICDHEEKISIWSKIQKSNFELIENFLLKIDQHLHSFILNDKSKNLEQLLVTLFPNNTNNNKPQKNIIQLWNQIYQNEMSPLQKEILSRRIFELTTKLTMKNNNLQKKICDVISVNNSDCQNPQNLLLNQIILNLRQNHITSYESMIRLLPLIHHWLLVTDQDQELTQRISSKLVSKFVRFCYSSAKSQDHENEQQTDDDDEENIEKEKLIIFDQFFDFLQKNHNNSNNYSNFSMTHEEFLTIKEYLMKRQQERSSALILLSVLVFAGGNQNNITTNHTNNSSSSFVPLLSLVYQNNNNNPMDHTNSVVRALLRDIVVDAFDLYELGRTSASSFKNGIHNQFRDFLKNQQQQHVSAESDNVLMTKKEIKLQKAKLSFFLLLQCLSSFSCYPFSNQQLLDLNNAINLLGKL